MTINWQDYKTHLKTNITQGVQDFIKKSDSPLVLMICYISEHYYDGTLQVYCELINKDIYNETISEYDNHYLSRGVLVTKKTFDRALDNYHENCSIDKIHINLTGRCDIEVFYPFDFNEYEDSDDVNAEAQLFYTQITSVIEVLKDFTKKNEFDNRNGTEQHYSNLMMNILVYDRVNGIMPVGVS